MTLRKPKTGKTLTQMEVAGAYRDVVDGLRAKLSYIVGHLDDTLTIERFCIEAVAHLDQVVEEFPLPEGPDEDILILPFQGSPA
jgi:hypothetical protein